MSRPTVTLWLDRYQKFGLGSIVEDQPRSGRPKQIASEIDAEIVRRVQEDPPPVGTHWTSRLMADQLQVSQSHVSRVWRAHGLAPHRIDYFKLSTNPRFVQKLRDVVGLYLDRPERAVVVSFDEKSQIQALDRTQPGLPLKKGRANANLRLQAAWNDDVVRGAGCGDWDRGP